MSLKIAPMQLLLEVTAQPPQALITHVAMARNRCPQTVAGIPPVLAKTGRSDLLDGLSATAWNHDPQSIDHVGMPLSSTRRIPNSRNAIITDGGKRAQVDCINRDLSGRSQGFPTICPIVHIDARNRWVGCFRVVGRSSGRLIIENGKKAFKWHKYKTRRISARPADGLDQVDPPEQPSPESEEANASELETSIPKRRPIGCALSPDSEALPTQSDDQMADGNYRRRFGGRRRPFGIIRRSQYMGIWAHFPHLNIRGAGHHQLSRTPWA